MKNGFGFLEERLPQFLRIDILYCLEILCGSVRDFAEM